MKKAVEYIGALKRGETKPHLFKCEDGETYVVKLMSNPVGKKILAHEHIANGLANYLSLPVAQGESIFLSEELIKQLPESEFSKTQPGPHFGCLYYKNAVRPTTENRIQKCMNLHQMAGIIVFDHWVRNRDRCSNYFNLIIDEGEEQNKIYMIDQAGCFFSSIRSSKRLKNTADYMDVFWGDLYKEFKPYLKEKELFYYYISAIEQFPDDEIKAIVHSTPPEWESDPEELEALAAYLIQRKEKLGVTIKKLLNNHIKI
ncbi:HipA family kinase [Halobacillus campisalis]|uniref:HipA family kinase n=1 Tax=Halobacillus campisalis TaxID=435909 RepID=A0ABW2K6I5_9BACI|nr:HipA family kinase [Halobacillus campisalis]